MHVIVCVYLSGMKVNTILENYGAVGFRCEEKKNGDGKKRQ